MHVRYTIRIGETALADLEKLPRHVADQVLRRIALLENNLHGDIKKLRGDDSRYRLRCGNYRVLFKLSGTGVLIVRVKHRKEAYGNGR